MLAWGGSTAATAQDSSRGILGLGNAVVTGFSGARPPAAPPRIDPIEKTFIDLDRPSARVIVLEALRGPPQGQVVQAPKPFSVTAAQVGQVFSIALDDATPPNIYLAATSAYGLPIVVPDRDGDGQPDRSRRGGPNANFMPGLFGPVTVNGGPGSIWRIDGKTGAVALFANVTLDRVANSGPALGGLAFDPATRQLFVADRDTGMIHRFGLDGADRGRFDHGVSGRPAVKLSAAPFDPRKRLDLTSPAFDSGNPRTWAYAPPERRIFGLAVRDGRLFYAVAAGLQVWSVAIAPAGGFATDPRLELNVPRGQSVAEISNIVFDEDSRMILAERGAPTGAYDYKALAESGENRVLRFRLKRPGDPPGPGLWYPVPEEYAIGFPPDFRNDNGGLAIGYGYDAGGNINRAACGGTLWSTGEQLRNARAGPIVQRLQPGGPLIVDGLQGNAIRLVRPQNEPPFESYYIDYDDRFDDAATRGHLGDVEIWRVCRSVALAPALLVCPPGWFNVDGVCLSGLACPPGTEFADGCCVYRGCPPSYVSIRGKCVPPPLNCKPDETYTNNIGPGRCEAPKCPPGLVVTKPKNGMNGDLRRAKSGTNGFVATCPDGQPRVNDQCPPPREGGKKICGGYCECPTGTKPGKDGTCVATPPIVCKPGYDQVGKECCTRGNSEFPPECYTPPPTNGGCSWFDQYIFRTCDPQPPSSCKPNPFKEGEICCTQEGTTDRRCCKQSDYDSKSGTCGPSIVIDCTGGKIFRDGACQCPSGATENIQTGTCGTPPPTTGGCTPLERALGRCDTTPDTQLPPFTTLCLAPSYRECCSESGFCVETATGACPSSRPIDRCITPPPDEPGQLLGVCPFSMVGGTCCDGNKAVDCRTYSTFGCPTNWTSQGGGVCCTRVSERDNFCAPPPPERVVIPP
ncbi:MAG: hypothetical protein Q7S17_02085, partial [Xanthobacteraceae bacterium]|nr:hypothetical protein [Xanthobacteraceae bacterium]